MTARYQSLPSPSTPAGQSLASVPGSPLMVVTKMVPQIDNAATGEAARKRRLSSLLSLREVAKECGWSAAHQSDLERGFRAWSEAKCLKVETAIKKLSKYE